ncbi:Fic family protein [Bacteroides timonensis]|uniref:Fic family protein n=1 Tax=Bacteroides timonensis TaxID=1470345 RepID=UPI0004B0E19B|nr:Fic family protein [Bacteroides timonensis]
MAIRIDTQKEIIFGSSDPNVSRVLSNKEKNGELRKIAPRIYTSNLIDNPENIVRRNLMEILAYRYPNALISHRSAKEMRPTPSGDFFLTSSTTRRVTDLPGIILNFAKGPQAIAKDIPFMGMHISGEFRYMLENMQVSRKSGDESRVLPIEVIETKLEQLLLTGGEDRLNEYRDELREVANELGMTNEFAKINNIISALLSTHDAEVLSTESAKARATGSPFDAKRVELFEILFDTIKDRYFVIRNNRNTDEESFRLFSFFESYFSNYIEGTEFDIEEAKEIVDSGIPMPRRDEDSHDILGTFKILSNRAEMMRTPTSPDELFSILSHRHTVLLEGRPHMSPGVFKMRNNRAGQTEFVDFQLVKGTLSQGFKYYSALTDPFAKAIFMMFMISEVHPFNDGNGRIARVMMNAEFVRADQSRIIVPTVFREDYILALRKLTRHKDPLAYINVMTKLHLFSDNLYGTDFTELKNYLATCNAYDEPSQAKLQIIDRTIL